MRAGLVVSAAFMAGVGFAGSAAAQETMWDGYVSVGTGNAWYSNPSQNSTDWLGQGRASAEFSLSGNWGTQLDVVGTQQNLAFPSDSNYHSIDLAAHAFYRQPGQWLLGPLFQYRTSTRSASGFAEDFEQSFIGGEAQGYLGKFSLYGQLAYQNDDLSFTTETGWIGRVRARFFVTPDWFLEANYLHSVLNGEYASYGSVEDTFGAATELHLPTLPLGVFAQYSYSDVRFGGGPGDYKVSRVLGGFKWYFGGQTLWGRETGGASLDPLPPPYMPVLPPV